MTIDTLDTTWERIQTLPLPTDSLRIGHNAKGSFAIVDNPLLLRAAGRALAHIVDEAQVFQRTDVTAEDELVNTIFYVTERDGERRETYTYTVRADQGVPFIRIFTDRKNDDGITILAHSRNHSVPRNWADGEAHRVWMTAVNTNGQRRLSRANYIRSYWNFHNKQLALGIDPAHEHFVNPLAMMTKDAFIALFSRKHTLGIRSTTLSRAEVLTILADFYHDELAAIAGLPLDERA